MRSFFRFNCFALFFMFPLCVWGKSDFRSFRKTGSVNLLYASQFTIDKYGEYSFVNIKGEKGLLVVPEGMEVPSHLPKKTVVLHQPLDKTYLVSSSAYDLILKCSAQDNITLTGTKARDWYIREAVSALESGSMQYAGKYNAPDFEKLVTSGCNLSIQNTMIYHKSDIKQKLEELGIPVLVEKSAYEEHPLGRIEWIKLYGCLYNREEEAEQFFNTRLNELKDVISGRSFDKTFAVFYITSNGLVNVRKSSDYIPKAIKLSGGKYFLDGEHESDGNTMSTFNMSVEEFYKKCIDTDVIIYNGTIDTSVDSLDDIIKKQPLLKDFKAVKQGSVYYTGKNMFQQPAGLFDFIRDISIILDGRDDGFTYVHRLSMQTGVKN